MFMAVNHRGARGLGLIDGHTLWTFINVEEARDTMVIYVWIYSMYLPIV